jgi:hypothetical protein
MQKQKKLRLNEPGDREYVVLHEDKKKFNCYIILQKIACVDYAQLCMKEDIASMNTVTDEISMSNLSLLRLINKLLIYCHITKIDQVRCSLVLSHWSQLEDVGPDLLAFVEDLHEKRDAVLRKMIVTQSSRYLDLTLLLLSSPMLHELSQFLAGWLRMA